MIDAPPPDPPAPPDDESLAVTELAALGVEPSPVFLARVRRRLDRRVLTSHILDLSVSGLLHVVVEFSGLIAGLIQRPVRRPDR